jgi:putative membrane protein insertion efficiency factor
MIARLLLLLIRVYRLALSPLLGGQCRFEPSCSRYAAACIATHGAARGSLLSVLRLCKCHPFHEGGFDPPPARFPGLRKLLHGSRLPEPLDPGAPRA